MKKILIRIIGALCILGAAAVMFFPSWFTVEDVSKKDFRAVRNDVSGIIDKASDSFIRSIDTSEQFRNELEDNDLPDTRRKIRARFREIEEMTTELLDAQVSMREITKMAFMMPGLLKDTENLLASSVSDSFFSIAANYAVYEGEEQDPNADAAYVSNRATEMKNMAEDLVDSLAGVSAFSIVFGILIIFFLLLGVVSAVMHVFNKCRWLKHVFLEILIFLVAVSCILIPIVSGTLSDALDAMPKFQDASLYISLTPFVAVALALVPIVLDIIFEGKKARTKTKEGENKQNG